MDLQVAPLGGQQAINLGGYIPAPAYRPSPWQEAMRAFLSGAGSAVAGHVADAALTKDYSQEASVNPAMVQAGVAPQAQGAVGRFFTPLSADQYTKMQALAGTENYQKAMIGAEGKRIGIESQRADTEKGRAQAETAAEQQRLKQQAEQFGLTFQQGKNEFDTKAGMEATGLTQKGKQSDAEVTALRAQAAEASAHAQQTELLNRNLIESHKSSVIQQVTHGAPPAAMDLYNKAAAAVPYDGTTPDAQYKAQLDAWVAQNAKGAIGTPGQPTGRSWMDGNPVNDFGSYILDQMTNASSKFGGVSPAY